MSWSHPLQRSVLVVGESLMDVVRREGGELRRPGGSPMNVAYGLGRLETPVQLLTSMGADADGLALAEHLTGAGVTLLPQSTAADRTGTAIATIDASGAADYDFDIEWQLPAGELDAEPAWVHVGSISAFLEPGASAVERLLARFAPNTTISFDPNIRPSLLDDHAGVVARFERVAAMSTLVKLSDEDAAWLYPATPIEQVLERVLGLGPRVVALTRGGAGAVFRTATKGFEVEAPAIRVADTIGAGDSFMSALIASLVEAPDPADPASVREAAEFAVRVAAYTCTQVGAAPPTRDELAGFRPSGS
jgi:fructokinase